LPIPSQAAVKDLVLVGGGHSHIAALRRLGERPLPGLRVTLVTRDVHTPYAGMLAGLVAGHYGYDRCHVDLGRLVRFAAARLYHAEVVGLDLANRQVLCRGRPPVRYDLLSLDVGSRPGAEGVPGVVEHALAVRPVDRFLAGWERVQARALASAGPYRLVFVGAGAGGVELLLSARHRLRERLRAVGRSPEDAVTVLVGRSAVLLPGHGAGARRRFERILGTRGIEAHLGHGVTRVAADHLVLDDGRQLPHDAVFWVTHAVPPAWVGAAGLAVDAQGFVRVDEHLQSASHPGVFAAGDVASFGGQPGPRCADAAVRQGVPLAENLCRAATGAPLRRYRARARPPLLIGTGEHQAVLARGGWSLEGAWAWRLKERKERRFMARHNELPPLRPAAAPAVAPGLADGETLRELSSLATRCGGCDAKVGATVLARVMNRLTTVARGDVVLGLQEPDDAAVLAVPAGKVLVQSVDYFRSFLDDPYVFGQVAANHALGDLFAMGAEPQSALAVVTVPYGREVMVEETIYELMSGALEVLNGCGAALVGGHTGEGAELALGLVVNGLADRARLLRKRGMRPGDVLVLTKPLGTGTLFAADLRGAARGRWLQGAIASMVMSNQAAAGCLVRHGARACTDVTGFGLLGHLVEMTRPSGVDAVLDLDALPQLEGAAETLRAGISSSLAPQNVRLRRAVRNVEELVGHPGYPLLFDPQTAGGLLASLPAAAAEACVIELRLLGYRQAAVIGRVEARTQALAPVRVVSRGLG
jgi:selenide,water dikinase